MAIGSGLAGQVALAQESTWGTIATPDHFYAINNEGVDFAKNILQGLGLRAGKKWHQSTRRVVSGKSGGGAVSMDHATRGMGLLWKHILGSAATATQISSTTAYKQVHQPGGLTGLGLTYQKGVPLVGGTVIPLTFNGGKVTTATFSVTNNQIAQLNPTFDFQTVDTATALAAWSPPSNNEVFSFQQASVFTIGGTVTTTSGVTSISGGTAIGASSAVNDFSLTVNNGVKTDRQGLGNQGLKKEQVENDYQTFTGAIAGEWASRTMFYDVMLSDAAVPLQLTFVGSQIGTSGQFNTLDIILPAVKFNSDNVNLNGPDVVSEPIDFEVLDDTVNPVCQVTIISADTAL